MKSVCRTASRIRVLFQDNSGGSGSWVLLKRRHGCWMPSVSCVWNRRGNWVCYMQCLLGPAIFWKMDLLCLHATFKILGHSKSSSLKKCWMYSACLSWLSCSAATGIAPAWPQEGFALFVQMCLCNVCAVWTAGSVKWGTSSGLKCDVSMCLAHGWLS